MGPMKVQMRRYTLKEGAKEAFQRVFLETIVPLRQALGFGILGAHEDFEEAERAYYAHPERQKVDPRAYLEAVETRFVERLL